MSATIRRSLSAAVAIVVIGVGLAGCAGSNDRSAHSSRAEVADPTSTPGNAGSPRREAPEGMEHGIPIGWPLDQAGAEAAALAYVRSTSVVTQSGPLARRDALLTMATTSFGPEMVQAVNDELDGLTVGTDSRAVAPGELVWHEYPLTVTSSMASPMSVEVRVWSVVIVGVEDGSVARQIWRTSTVTLEVERGDWKVAGWDGVTGPTPVALNDTDLASVADLDDVTSWSVPGAGA
jgi:hypothetical protein